MLNDEFIKALEEAKKKYESCDHVWKFDVNLGRCYNQYKCTKCGALEQVDSGD